MFKKRNVKFGKILSYIIPFILGWIAHMGFLSYEKYINRPKLDFKISQISINEHFGGSSILKIIIDQENKGETEAMYNIENCVIYFPLLNSKPLDIEINEKFLLNARSIRTDTLNIRLTFNITEQNMMKFDSLNYVKLMLKETRLNKNYIVKRESNEIRMHGGISNNNQSNYLIIGQNSKSGEKDTINPEYYAYLEYNPDKKRLELIRGIYKIVYENITYTNYYLPNTAKVAHNIEDDKIYLEYKIDIDPKGNPTPGFVFIPDKRIEDKIILPKYFNLSVSYSDSTQSYIKVLNPKVGIETDYYGVIVYYIFNN